MTAKGIVTVKAYEVLRRAVEEGAMYGFSRAHKHTDRPGQDEITGQIVQAVMNEICLLFEFDKEESDG